MGEIYGSFITEERRGELHKIVFFIQAINGKRVRQLLYSQIGEKKRVIKSVYNGLVSFLFNEYNFISGKFK